ncbi:hypothetical protein [uncultured Parasphingopyxis sp.]|uniref:hypothetical protein n=1 Tax=uncultured Parasphingopyxis sp. TaxID=1547918 RepID=UPI002629E004|nr:hypothetical protein [uncultured Parasphingopyxis sp.]
MQSGIQRLVNAPSDSRALAIELLDEVSRPMSPRDLDRAFMDAGFTRTKAREMTKSLKGFNVIALVPDQ